MEVLSGVLRRRNWSAEVKEQIVSETLEPGITVTEVARRGDRDWQKERGRPPRYAAVNALDLWSGPGRPVQVVAPADSEPQDDRRCVKLAFLDKPSMPNQAPLSRRPALSQRFLGGSAAELIAFGLGFGVLLAFLLAVDAFDALHAWFRAHEHWELDEIFLAFCALGVTGFAFVVRRWRTERRHKLQVQWLVGQLEWALRAAKAADEAKSAFLANLSHELRTPLNAINGYAQVMETGMMGPIDARYAGYAKDIRESGDHLLGLINDILDVSRTAAGSVKLRLEPVDLHDLAVRCFRLLDARAKDSEIALANLVPADLPPLLADPQRLSQVLINLLSNAIKFSPAGSHVQLDAALLPEGVRLSVRDQGIGMDHNDVARALQPFVQLADGLTKSQDGAGLGLALVKHFVELHGGTITFDTAPGRGTTVTVTLPQPEPVAMALGERSAWR